MGIYVIVSDVCDGITCTDVDNDATCAPGDDGVGYCTCSSNRYDGPRCEIGKNSGIQPMTINGTMIDIRINTFKLTDLCPTNMCENSGTCLIGMDGEPYCSCSAGYSGDACEIGNQAEILKK